MPVRMRDISRFFIQHVDVMSAALDEFEDFVKERVEKFRLSYKQISTLLQEKFPGRRGFSERSVQRFCSRTGIHKTPRIDDHRLDNAVARATAMVGKVGIRVFF